MPSRRAIVIGAAAVCVAGAGVGYGLSQVGGNGSTPSASVSNGPVRVVSVTPAAGATRVNGANSVTVTFNQPVAPNSAHPALQPSVPGRWTAQGNSLVFTPTTAFAPSSRETVRIPAGPSGVRSAGGRLLSKPMTEHFTTGSYSQARLAELLAQLGYLPLNFSPQVSGVGRIQVPQGYQQNNSQQALAFDPPVGSFSWTQPYPSTLTSLWTSGSANVVVKGAVMAFQSQHKMTVNGAETPRLWTALFRAELAQQVNKKGYTYAVANKGSPETLTIWHNGREVLRSLTNTGIPVSPTVDGTFPVFLRLPFQIMQGTNPGGSSYADPVWWVSYFNGGDAVHYFPRGSYGWPQSLGCVELPWNDAKAAYPYLTYGSLVTVDG
jgi:Bacterial Ig-like domain/L,D-transpeptidase catalytic domain